MDGNAQFMKVAVGEISIAGGGYLSRKIIDLSAFLLVVSVFSFIIHKNKKN